jgi:hypothetical protein
MILQDVTINKILEDKVQKPLLPPVQSSDRAPNWGRFFLGPLRANSLKGAGGLKKKAARCGAPRSLD